MSSATDWMPWAQAWSQALYGPAGFYHHAAPSDHFRTSVHASPLFAKALVTLARELDLETVVDLGSGGGELLHQLERLAPHLHLVGVELRPRPATLSRQIGWLSSVPSGADALLVANELLDNIACDVVERDPAGSVREVEVQPSTGNERLGAVVSAEVARWVDRWWPLAEPGLRAEVGLARENLWAAVRAGMGRGACLAIDYGHTREARPRHGSLTSYRDGRKTPTCLDGKHDVSASVAMDALADRVGGSLATQRHMLRGLGIHGRRPPLSLATSDPQAYVRALAQASQAAELTAPDGLGAFHWLLTPSTGRTWQHERSE